MQTAVIHLPLLPVDEVIHGDIAKGSAMGPICKDILLVQNHCYNAAMMMIYNIFMTA